MVQNLLGVIQGETSEYSQATVKPDTFAPHECSCSSSGKDEWRKTADSNEGYTSEEWTTEVEVFLLLSCCTDEGDRAHHGHSVETGTCEEGRLHEEDGGDDGGLGDVEGGPKCVFLDVAMEN